MEEEPDKMVGMTWPITMADVAPIQMIKLSIMLEEPDKMVGMT